MTTLFFVVGLIFLLGLVFLRGGNGRGKNKDRYVCDACDDNHCDCRKEE